jgi:hypothetical protein
MRTAWRPHSRQADGAVNVSLAAYAVKTAVVHSQSFTSATRWDIVEGCSALLFGTAKADRKTQG